MHLQVEEVSGGFVAGAYCSATIWAASHDGVRVPASVAYRRDLLKGDGTSPCVLYG